MKIKQFCWSKEGGWDKDLKTESMAPDVVFIFGAPSQLSAGSCQSDLLAAFPDTCIFGCSGGGEILGSSVLDDCIVATAVSFKSASVKMKCLSITDCENSEELGKEIVGQLPHDHLKHIVVLSDDYLVDGTEFVCGMNASLPEGVVVTGGFATDEPGVGEAYVVYNDQVKRGATVALGLYGNNLRIGYGSCGGWAPFGPEWLITSADGNSLNTLDGNSALELYKKYLGADYERFPDSGRLYPLHIRPAEGVEGDPIVRTVKSVNEDTQALQFVGDIPTGWYARFMQALPDNLIDGAVKAAEISTEAFGKDVDFALLVSCVARRNLLQQLVEEETEGVEEVFKTAPAMAGFYSFGEFAPFGPGGNTILHNQTMTITTLSEET